MKEWDNMTSYLLSILKLISKCSCPFPEHSIIIYSTYSYIVREFNTRLKQYRLKLYKSNYIFCVKSRVANWCSAAAFLIVKCKSKFPKIKHPYIFVIKLNITKLQSVSNFHEKMSLASQNSCQQLFYVVHCVLLLNVIVSETSLDHRKKHCLVFPFLFTNLEWQTVVSQILLTKTPTKKFKEIYLPP